MFLFVVLIDAIVRNGGTTAPQANNVPPPTGWRDEDIRNNETSNASSDDKKSYTEDQRQGVLRCTVTRLLHLFFTLLRSNRLTTAIVPYSITLAVLNALNNLYLGQTLVKINVCLYLCRHNIDCRMELPVNVHVANCCGRVYILNLIWVWDRVQACVDIHYVFYIAG